MTQIYSAGTPGVHFLSDSRPCEIADSADHRRRHSPPGRQFGLFPLRVFCERRLERAEVLLSISEALSSALPLPPIHLFCFVFWFLFFLSGGLALGTGGKEGKQGKQVRDLPLPLTPGGLVLLLCNQFSPHAML